MITKNDKLNELIDAHDKIMIFSGAGVSTLSGIPDFRGKHGLYNDTEQKINPRKILSKEFFTHNKKEYWDFHLENLNYEGYEPASTHLFAKKLELNGKLNGVVTQNIDGLYQKAGLSNVVEIHGNATGGICQRCKQEYKLSNLERNRNGKILSPCCGQVVRPSLVLYGDQFVPSVHKAYQELLQSSDLLIVMGTGLDIIPHYINTMYFEGKICLINKEDIELTNNGATRNWDLKVLDTFENIFY